MSAKRLLGRVLMKGRANWYSQEHTISSFNWYKIKQNLEERNLEDLSTEGI